MLQHSWKNSVTLNSDESTISLIDHNGITVLDARIDIVPTAAGEERLAIKPYPHELEENFAVNVVNIDPQTTLELRMILEKSFVGKSLNDEQLQEMRQD